MRTVGTEGDIDPYPHPTHILADQLTLNKSGEGTD